MRWLAAILALFLGATVAVQADSHFARVQPDVALAFPRDHGAHPDFRLEWWYVTGWLTIEDGSELGFQVTFFRSRPEVDPANPSRFAPAQVLFAHAALSDPDVGRLLHGERAARAGFGIAEAPTGDAAVVLRDWSLEREPAGRFTTEVLTPEFALALTLTPTQEIFLQGEDGFSRKGPGPDDASHYYSMPHLEVAGTLMRDGTASSVTGTAWLDREWSSNFLAPNAVGWEWVGLNLDDGGALVAFRIRDRDDRTVWAGGSLRRADGSVTRFSPGDVTFTAVRRWRSPRTDALYPVEQVLTLRLPGGEQSFPLSPLFDDQELGGRATGLPVYWEGAIRTVGGKGYLELTGYALPLSL